MEDFELRFVKNLPDENDNFSIIFDDKRYNGWYKYRMDAGGCIDLIIRFRMPETLHLYGDVARNFLPEERLVGVHRMLVGKDLQEETKSLLNHTNINEYVSTLDDSQVNNLLNRMKNMATMDCNKIPYLHIRLKKNSEKKERDYSEIIKEYIKKQPNFIKIFYNILNQKINMEEAYSLSNGVIFSEYLEVTKK